MALASVGAKSVVKLMKYFASFMHFICIVSERRNMRRLLIVLLDFDVIPRVLIVMGVLFRIRDDNVTNITYFIGISCSLSLFAS